MLGNDSSVYYHAVSLCIKVCSVEYGSFFVSTPIKDSLAACGVTTSSDQDHDQRNSEDSQQQVIPRRSGDKMPKSSGDGAAPTHTTQLEVLIQNMVQQLQFQHEEMKIQHEEMKMLLSPLVSSRGGAQETQKSQYDQLNKDVEKFVADEDAGQTLTTGARGMGLS
ncbi:hypothetical protein V3C99_012185 [Haemonchus contortus]